MIMFASQGDAVARGDGVDVFVATAGEIDDDAFAAPQFARQFQAVGDGMRRFQRRDDAFETAEVRGRRRALRRR